MVSFSIASAGDLFPGTYWVNPTPVWAWLSAFSPLLATMEKSESLRVVCSYTCDFLISCDLNEWSLYVLYVVWVIFNLLVLDLSSTKTWSGYIS